MGLGIVREDIQTVGAPRVSRPMTWKRVVTALVLITCVVALVLRGSTALVSLAVALVMLLALFEYFALGEAIGHRAYRFWTATCALVMVYVQWRAAVAPSYELSGGLILQRKTGSFPGGMPSLEMAFFLFVLGIAVLTLSTRRPFVEALPAAGINPSGLLLVAFPVTVAIRPHGLSAEGPVLLLFAAVITWGGGSAAYFLGRAVGKHPLAPHLSPKKTWEGTVASFLGSLVVSVIFTRC